MVFGFGVWYVFGGTDWGWQFCQLSVFWHFKVRLQFPVVCVAVMLLITVKTIKITPFVFKSCSQLLVNGFILYLHVKNNL